MKDCYDCSLVERLFGKKKNGQSAFTQLKQNRNMIKTINQSTKHSVCPWLRVGIFFLN